MNERCLDLADGTRLWVRHTGSVGSGGTVVLVHGLGEHSGRYSHVTRELVEIGWSVVAYDQRGHGRSSGPRGGIARSSALLEDLSRVIDLASEESLPTPLVLLGHSMGGAVAARFVAESLAASPAPWSRFVGALVLSSPALAQDLSWKNRAKLSIFARVAPDLAVWNGLSITKLSHDQTVIESYRSDPLVHDRVTPRLVRFIVTAGTYVRKLAAHWRTPTLLLWAGNDALVAARGSREFAAEAPASIVQSHEFPTFYHEILNEAEPGRREVFARLERWVATVAMNSGTP